MTMVNFFLIQPILEHMGETLWLLLRVLNEKKRRKHYMHVHQFSVAHLVLSSLGEKEGVLLMNYTCQMLNTMLCIQWPLNSNYLMLMKQILSKCVFKCNMFFCLLPRHEGCLDWIDSEVQFSYNRKLFLHFKMHLKKAYSISHLKVISRTQTWGKLLYFVFIVSLLCLNK